MASPPASWAQSPTALSPPYPSHSSLPTGTSKKRPPDHSSACGHPPTFGCQRRKVSNISIASVASTHPLRQTSFPPEDNNAHAVLSPHLGPRSPSVDSMSIVSVSQVSANPAPFPPSRKRRGRKSKAEKAREAREPTPSLVGSRGGGSAFSGASATGVADGAGGQGEEDAEDEGAAEMAVLADKRTKEEKEEEMRTRPLLTKRFTSEQFERYEAYRGSGLGKPQLINATVSQSVSDTIVLSIRAVTKFYLGELVEMACRVQSEWMAKTGEKYIDSTNPPSSQDASPSGSSVIPDAGNGEASAIAAALQAIPADRRGPLLPEHFREALRRYKKAQEGGGAGTQMMWNFQGRNGVERFPTRTGGRRICR